MNDDDDIEVHFDESRGLLGLGCGPTAFSRILDAIRNEASFDDVEEIPPEDVHEIWISESAPSSEQSEAQTRDTIALLGCATVGFCILFVLVAGVIQIAAWFKN